MFTLFVRQMLQLIVQTDPSTVCIRACFVQITFLFLIYIQASFKLSFTVRIAWCLFIIHWLDV